MVGGQGTVYKRDGVIGGEFELAGFLGIAAAARDKNLQVGNGGAILVTPTFRLSLAP
jgi:hypothetical protein